MPELPEVQTIASDLLKHLLGYEVKKVIIAKNYHPHPSIEEFTNKLMNQKIVGVERVAKNILLELSSGNYLQFHFAMTGRLLLRSFEEKSDKWVKIILVISKNKDMVQLRFSDMRAFGKVGVLTKEGYLSLKKKYGPEILDDKISPDIFLKLIKSKKTNIKNVLLDQGVVSGLGNIYATDALFLAGVFPKTPTSKISPEQARKLLESSRNILRESIKNRGATLPDKMYVDLFGKPGSHQNFFRIYMKTKCKECGNKVAFIKINDRGTYYCPICQPENVD